LREEGGEGGEVGVFVEDGEEGERLGEDFEGVDVRETGGLRGLVRGG
jgi:hypothetical protein